MSEAMALGTRDYGSLWIAAFIGWLVAVLFGLMVLIIYVALTEGPPLPTTIGDLFGLLGVVIAVWLTGAFLSFPAPILAGVILSVAERISLQTRRLPVWLATGVIASMPTADYVWDGFVRAMGEDDATPVDVLYRWDSVRMPLLILSCGLVGAIVAWRRRQAMLAR